MTSIATVRRRFLVHIQAHLSFGITADSKTKQSKQKAVQVRATDAHHSHAPVQLFVSTVITVFVSVACCLSRHFLVY